MKRYSSKEFYKLCKTKPMRGFGWFCSLHENNVIQLEKYAYTDLKYIKKNIKKYPVVLWHEEV